MLPSSNDSSSQPWLSDVWTQVSGQPVPAPTEVLKTHPPRIRVPRAFPYRHQPTSYTPEAMLPPQLGNSNYITSDPATPVHGLQRNPSPYSEISDSQQYPSSGLSPNSDQPLRASPMSVNSYRPGVSPTQLRTEEPPRDAEGSIFCSHVDCSTSKKTFQRKCEWRLALPPKARLNQTSADVTNK